MRERRVMHPAVIRRCTPSAARLASESITEGHLIPREAAYWDADIDATRLFCAQTGRYALATVETLEEVDNLIGRRRAIEICAGCGDFAYHLHLPATDSKLHNSAIFQASMRLALGGFVASPVYGAEVEELEALAAVRKYQPQVVLAAWSTQLWDDKEHVDGVSQASVFGVDERALFALPFVETYIVVGNMDIHGEKLLRRQKHDVLSGPQYGLVSRAHNPANNCIFVWNK